MTSEYGGHNNHLSCLQDLSNIKGLKILTLNIPSLLPKIDILRVDFDSINFHILVLTESWLKPSIDDSLLGLKDLKFARLDRSILNRNGDLKPGGGIICYYKSYYSCCIKNETTFCTPELEMLSVKPSMENHVDFIVVSVYRPPTSTVSVALDKIRDVCENVCATTLQYYILIIRLI